MIHVPPDNLQDLLPRHSSPHPRVVSAHVLRPRLLRCKALPPSQPQRLIPAQRPLHQPPPEPPAAAIHELTQILLRKPRTPQLAPLLLQKPRLESADTPSPEPNAAPKSPRH